MEKHCRSCERNASGVRVEPVYFSEIRFIPTDLECHGIGDFVAPRWLYDPLLEMTRVGPFL